MLLALTHRVGDDQLVGVDVGYLPVHQRLRDHADGVRARFAGRLGDSAHHRDVAAAGDQLPTASADRRSHVRGELEVLAVHRTRRAVHADRVLAAGRSPRRLLSAQRVVLVAAVCLADDPDRLVDTVGAPTADRGPTRRSSRPAPASPRIQSTSPDQYSVPNSTIGNRVILRVCTRVSASNSSSRVPKPPGRQTNACEYFTNIVLRAKKYRKLRPRSTHSLSPCSKGSSMPSPIEKPPGLARAAVGGLHDPGATAGDDGVSGLDERRHRARRPTS